MLKLVAVIFQGVKCFIFNFPAGLLSLRNRFDIFFMKFMVSYPCKKILFTFRASLYVLQEIYANIFIAFI